MIDNAYVFYFGNENARNVFCDLFVLSKRRFCTIMLFLRLPERGDSPLMYHVYFKSDESNLSAYRHAWKRMWRGEGSYLCSNYMYMYTRARPIKTPLERWGRNIMMNRSQHKVVSRSAAGNVYPEPKGYSETWLRAGQHLTSDRRCSPGYKAVTSVFTTRTFSSCFSFSVFAKIGNIKE